MHIHTHKTGTRTLKCAPRLVVSCLKRFCLNVLCLSLFCLKLICLNLIFLNVGGGSLAHAEPLNLIDYEFAGAQYYGYLAKPHELAAIEKKGDTSQKRYPGILLVPDAYGQSEQMRSKARALASQGFIVFAIDMYGNGHVATSGKEANIRANELIGDIHQVHGRFTAAKRFFSEMSNVDSAKIGALGYCFGGSVVLSMAEAGVNLTGVVSVSGDLDYPPPAESFGSHKAPALILQGSLDTTVPSDPVTLKALKKRLTQQTASLEWITYAGADHGFYNTDSADLAVEFNTHSTYHGEADEKSWEALSDFFQRRLMEDL